MAFFGFGKKKEEKSEEKLEVQQPAAANAQESVPADEEKKGLFSRLWNGLSKTRTNVAGRVDELIEATEEIDEDFYEDLVDILIMSDMGVRTSDKVIEELKSRIEEDHRRAQGARDPQADPQRDHGYAQKAAPVADDHDGCWRERRGQDHHHRQACHAL